MAEPENGNANRLRPNENEQNILQTQWNKTIQTLNTILIAIFQVVGQEGICSAIKTHPIVFKSYVVAIVIYAVACVCCTPGILPSSIDDIYLGILRAAVFLMGTLATTLLLMVIVPVFGWIVFAVWVLVCVSLAWRFRAEIFGLIRLAIDSFVSLLSRFSPANYKLPVQL